MNEIAQKVAKSDTIVTISICFSGKVPEWEEIAATAMAVQNMYLTCTAHSVGCYWGTPGFMFQMKDFLQLEENERCYGFFFMGMKK
jgi:nitroreductase